MEPIVFQNSKNTNLSGVLSAPPGASSVIILAHGFGSNKNRDTYTTYETLLNRQGWATFRFDFFGHGESAGKFEDITVSEGIDDILCAIKFLQKKGFKKIALLGTSFGGNCALLAACKSKDLTALILRSAVSDYNGLETSRKKPKVLNDWEQAGFIKIEEGGQIKKLNFNFFKDLITHREYDEAKKISIPVLITHGDRDDVVPLEQSERLHTVIPHSELVVITGAGHRYTDRKALFKLDTDAAVAFLKKNL
ncbi:MAG: alpha/beta hydrolase family protein [Candidatus Levyibacteriota bacterium]